MTEQTTLDELKAYADEQGIKYTAKTTQTQLQKLIDKHNEDVEAQVANDVATEVTKDAMKLLRVIITPMNPLKRDIQGDIFSVGNSVIPTYTKYVPYNVEWHIPQIMYDMLNEKEETAMIKSRDNRGRDVIHTRTIKAFNIAVLPPLTQAQLDELARVQSVREQADNLM